MHCIAWQLSPWMMGWTDPLAEILVLGQMAFSYIMHLFITLALLAVGETVILLTPPVYPY